ncbi:hypothetical protein GCM10020331_100230 [Ectobacillus funiculus]
MPLFLFTLIATAALHLAASMSAILCPHSIVHCFSCMGMDEGVAEFAKVVWHYDGDMRGCHFGGMEFYAVYH